MSQSQGQPSMTRHFTVATAGHVDHGKSALVKALTGTDPDRLPEEKARGITIDLGFAHLELERAADVPPARFSVGIVDVPGHEDFVKNMVAGVGSIDLALLVVAADDGWMPQTEEHLQILLYLGVTQAVVAVTKIDLATDEDAAERRVRDRLAGTPFAEALLVRTSVIEQRGLEDLKEALAVALSRRPPPADIGKPRLWVDRVFALKGIGTVVTGTLSGGSLHRGDEVVIQPDRHMTRLRAIQSHNRDVPAVGPGMRAALNLPDVQAAVDAAGARDSGVRRGSVITLPQFGDATATFDVVLERSARPAGEKTPAARPIGSGARVRVHLGSGHAAARLLLLDKRALAPGETGVAQLRFETPLFGFAGDRFIVRDWSGRTTLAGGSILDPDAPRRHARDPDRVAALACCLGAMDEPVGFVRMRLLLGRLVRSDSLLVRSRFAAVQIAAAVKMLIHAQDARVAGPFLATTAYWEQLRTAGSTAVDSYHQAHPERAGLPVSELRSELEKRLGSDEGFDELVSDLGRSGFTLEDGVVRRSSHRPALPEALMAVGERIRSALATRPLDPPGRAQLAPDGASISALKFLVRTGAVVELNADTVLSADAFASARERVREMLRDRHRATASELRQLLGTSRRILIPLLERLDRDGVTRREGDFRRLRG